MIRVAITLASAVAWALCFGREPSLWLGWVALAPLLVALGDRRTTARQAAGLGLLHGMVYWMLCVHWIAATIRTFGHLPAPLAWLFMGLAALFLSPHSALFAVAAHRLLRDPPTGPPPPMALPLIGLPAVWVVTEWTRSHALGSLSFPWNLAAYAWVDVLGVLPLAAWIGPWGVSFLVVMVSTALALAWRRRSPLAASAAVLSALVILTLAARFSQPEAGPIWAHGQDVHFPDRGREVRLVQPNQGLQESEAAIIRRQYEQLMDMTRGECAGDTPTLILWPESAAWPHSWEGSWRLRQDLGRLASRGCTVLLNSPTTDKSRTDAYFNSAILAGPPPAPGQDAVWEEAVLQGMYHKRFLVPWGEHVPLADVFPFIDKLARFAGRFSAGQDPGLLSWNQELLGLALCYEIIFPGAMVDQVQAGATVLVNISNDAWYGDTSAPRQLFRAARFRAAENRRPLLRVGLTGISGVIDARGGVRERLELGQRGVLRERLVGGSELTPYARWPWLVPAICLILAVLSLARILRGARAADKR